MTKEQYETFKTIVEKKGYKLSNARGTIHSEHFYYYKGFAYPDEEDAHPGYQIIFLVWDHSEYIREGLDDYIFGVSPLILTSSDEWQRIDLQITEQNFDVDKVEDFACVFYHSFINKEQPLSEKLEEAAEKAAFHQYVDSEDNYISENEKQKFIEGAEWKEKQLMENPLLYGWVARDGNGSLHVFEVEPLRISNSRQWWDRDYQSTCLDSRDFPDLKWEDEPVYVKMVIIKE